MGYLSCIMRYATALAVGVGSQNAKAVYPDPGVVKTHWQQNPKIFKETFDVLFPKAEWLPFWGEYFPDWFKDQNGNPCEIEMGSDRLSFHTLDDLDKLPCDADLKKIIKILGSTEFLEKVLSETVVKSIFAHAFIDEYFKTKIRFTPFNKNHFFIKNKCGLIMEIEQSFDESMALKCSFHFVFELRSNLVVMKDYDVKYDVGDKGYIHVEFLKKLEKIPDFPWDAVKKAKKKFPLVYAKLRDDLKNERRRYEFFKICSAAENAKEQVQKSFLKDTRSKRDAFDSVGYGDPYEVSDHEPLPSYDLAWRNVEPLLDVLITEDFLKEVFGETFWNILEYYFKNDFIGKTLKSAFHISKYGEGYKVSYAFNNLYRGNMEYDAITFSGEKPEWEWLDFIAFNFVFFYDPKKDEISNVKLQDRLVLNYEHRFNAKTSDGLIVVDGEDSKARCNSFEELLKKNGIDP